MVFNANNYFDIWNILTFEIVGSANLMMILGLLAIAFFATKTMMPFQTGITSMLLWTAIVSILTANIGLWTLVVFIVGLLFYWIMSRMFRRN